MEFWLSATGFPPVVVIVSSFLAINIFQFQNIPTDWRLLLKYFVPLITIGAAYGDASTPLRCGCGSDGKLLARSRAMPRLTAVLEPADSKTRGRTWSTAL